MELRYHSLPGEAIQSTIAPLLYPVRGPMKAALFKGMLVAALMLTTAVGQAADLRVRVDAREVARKRVHTDLTLAVHEGPLTLVFPKWIPGEHGPTGTLESIIGLVIRANGAPLAWRRDRRDMYAISLPRRL